MRAVAISICACALTGCAGLSVNFDVNASYRSGTVIGSRMDAPTTVQLPPVVLPKVEAVPKPEPVVK